jgi:hypothetical protein
VRLGDAAGGVGALALGGLGFAVDHVVAGDFLFAGTHQGQFDLVLDFFDMDGAARWHAALEGGGDLFGQALDGFMDTRRGGSGAALYSEKGLGDGNGDLVIGVRHHGAVTLDHAQLARRGGAQVLVVIGGLRRVGLRVLAGGVGLHENLHVLYLLVGRFTVDHCDELSFIPFQQRHAHSQGPGV